MNARRFKALLAESGMDAVVASSLENVSYLSGARIVMQRLIPDRLALLVWPGQGDPAIVVCKGEDVACRDDCRIEDMRAYTEFVTSPIDLLADVVVEKGLANGRLGVESRLLPAAYVDRLRTRLPGATLVDCGDLMDRTRMIKTPEEVDALAGAGRATERAIHGAFELASVGDSEKKVADDITAGVTSAGADVLNFMFLGTGRRSFEWHARPGTTRLRAGHVLHTDVAGNFIGYWSDLARTAFVGNPGPPQLDIYRRLYQTHVETLDAIRPGLHVRELYSVCQTAYRKVGLPFQLAHIGHGLGLGLHEYPMLKPSTDEMLQPGMVLCIEPAYLDPGVAGYHIEDLVLVNEKGREVLTDYASANEAQVIT
ncbi:MAG: Xaa-Pro peptidase family protein [Chloroflexi bacterium]|nr:Xaa-Pro peptidase family protein [Chloroflexota bacterium]